MSKNEKAKKRILNIPSDYQYLEARYLLGKMGFEEFNKGKTSGSRVKFYREKDSVKWSMKKWAKTKRLDWTLKIADISVRDRFPPPLTAHKRTAVGDSPTAKNSRTVRDFSVVYSSVAVFLRAIKGTAAGAVAGLLPLAWNLRTVRAFGRQI